MSEAPKTTLLPPLLAFVISSIILVLAAFQVFQGLRDYRRADVENTLKAVATLKMQQLDAWMLERKGDMALFTQDHLFTEGFGQWLKGGARDDDLKRAIHARMAALQRHYGYDMVVLFDNQGRARLSLQEGYSFNDHHPVMKAAIRQRDIRLIDFHQQDQQHVRIGITGPLLTVQNDQTRPLGTLLMTMDAERHLFPMLRQWPLPSPTAETVLARQEGEELLFIVTRKAAPMSTRIPVAGTNVPMTRIARGERGILANSQDYVGEPVLAYGDRVPGTSWMLVAKQDQSEVDAPLLEAARWLALIMFLLLAGGAAISIFWWRNRENSYQARILQQKLEKAEYIRKAHEKLQASEEKYRILADYSNDWEYWVAPDGRFYYLSPACEQVCGYSADEFLSEPDLMERIIHPDDRDHWRRHLQEPVSSSESSSRTFVMRILTKSGEQRWIENVSTSVVGHSQRFKGHRGSNRDITERKQLEKDRAEYQARLENDVQQRTADLQRRTGELEVANQDLESFSYSVSHDLRAPLRAINGFISILLEDYSNKLDAEGNRLFTIVRENADKMAQLIDDILALSRAGRLELEPGPVDMNKLVEEVWQGLAEQYQDRNIRLDLAQLPEAWCDPRALRQVWQNLLDNALKFTRDRNPAVITISASLENDSLGYSIRDNGVGFDSRYQNKLFTLFQRMHGMDEFEGSGVGLAIVQRLLRRHGGNISGSGETGVGACFEFSLPQHRAQPEITDS